MAAVLSDFWKWWMYALREIACRALLSTTREADRLVLELHSGEMVALQQNTPLKSRQITTSKSKEGELFPLRQLEARLSAKRNDESEVRSELAVRLKSGRFVMRKLSPLALPASQLKAAAVLDLVTATPFKPEDVHVLAIEQSNSGAAYAIVNRSILDPLLVVLHANRFDISHLEFEAKDGLLLLASFERRVLRKRSNALSNFPLKASSVGLAFALIATAGHIWVRNDRSLDALNVMVEGLTTDAKVTRQALDKRSTSMQELLTLRKNFEDAEAVTGVWEELARILPDSAYLTDLDIKGSKVAIAGYAAQAAALVVALEQSSMFSKASFTAAVVKSPGQDGERFQISVETGGAG